MTAPTTPSTFLPIRTRLLSREQTVLRLSADHCRVGREVRGQLQLADSDRWSLREWWLYI
jgi:hypothetical protein